MLRTKLTRMSAIAALGVAVSLLVAPLASAAAGDERVTDLPPRLTISYVGDCTFASTEAMEGSSLAFHRVVQDDYAYPFAYVRTYFTSDDLTIANLECALTTARKRAVKRFTFRARPDYVRILSENGVEAVSLANNHTRDLLEAGRSETKRVLNEAGVLHFEGTSVAIYNKGEFRVGMLGYSVFEGGVAPATIAKLIKALRNDGCNLVIVSCHWGIEGKTVQSAAQTKTARYFLDAGADSVVGHHPHRLQPIERYKGRTILYSLGNFCFGGNTGPSSYDTVLVQESFEIRDDFSVVSLGLNVVPCDQRSDPSKKRPNYQPRPVKGATADRIYRTLRWSAQQNFLP